jgi:hypothetical protein
VETEGKRYLERPKGRSRIILKMCVSEIRCEDMC